MSKEEFLNYVGHLYYAKYRCIEIYDRLQDIEDEAQIKIGVEKIDSVYLDEIQ